MNLRQSVFRAYLCIALPVLVFFPHLLMAQTVQADSNQNQFFYFMFSLTTIALGVILALSFKIRRDSKIQQSYYSVEKLLDITPDLVICVDKNGTITHANSTAKQFFGYADDLIGLPLTQLISAENRVSHAELQKAFFTGPKASMMAKGRRVQAILKDGSYRDLAISLGHSTINTQQTAVAFMRDVTQENALKRQLQNFKQRTDLACTIGKLTFWQWDKKRDVICTSTETDKPNLVDTAVSTKQFLKQFPASDRELFLAKLNFCTLSGRPETFEIQMEGNKHAVKHYRVMMAPLFSDDDPESGIVGLIQDISEQQQIEYQLRIATKAAESANIAKSQFLSNMSHEIRTPMNAVSGIMTLLLNSTLPENQAKLVRTAHAASESLVSIVNDILDFSKLETGELKITQSAFNLDQILNQLVDFYSPTATSKSLLLQLDVKPEVYVNLIGDSLRLSQILGNLVNNALKFTDAGKVRVSVDRVLSHTTSCRLRFSVKDTGVGMSEEQVQTLCTPFTQLDNSTTRKHGGTGLGLTICKRLLSMMGATLVTQSAKGRGSEFSFEIDFQLPDNAKRYLDLITDTKKAMIVIEDAELEQTVTQYFVHWGIKIACFNNTKRAYQVLSESAEDFDLLLAHIGCDEEYGR
ncbi:MAG TPA: ATP-binding protein, partial [Rheinheimera sp.]|nr:ATP-binding protein [Rheinheimera sp.]